MYSYRVYGGIGGGVLVDIVHHTGVDSFSAATAQGWTAGAGLYEVMSACRKLEVNLPRHTKGEPLHVVVDATGIKVYGKGEWQVTRHGWSKQRTWRKLPVGVDQANGEILAAAVITDACSDGQLLPELLDQSDADIAQVAGDSAYDTHACYTGSVHLKPRRRCRQDVAHVSGSMATQKPRC